MQLKMYPANKESNALGEELYDGEIHFAFNEGETQIAIGPVNNSRLGGGEYDIILNLSRKEIRRLVDELLSSAQKVLDK